MSDFRKSVGPKDSYDPETLDRIRRYWRERAMNFLVRREHSEIELRQKLTQRECAPWLLDEIIEWLYENRYLSLERFAYSHAKNRADLGYGPIKVRYELVNQHQIPQQFVDLAFQEIDWERSRKIALRKIGHKEPIKLKAALYRRGFLSSQLDNE